MRAQILKAFGGVENFELADLPKPQAMPGQVLIRVRASSVNPVDYKLRQLGPVIDVAPDLPFVLGMDVAGVVEAVGEGVTGFQTGDEVYGCAGGLGDIPGACAEYMAADARLIALKPKSVSFAEAAALPLVAITAWEALYDRARISAGDSVLVHGGAGGVGHIGVQLAKAAGAVVHTTVSSTDKARIARELGADGTIDYRSEPVADYTARITGGRGFDVVFDTIGGENIQPSFEAARVGGQVSTIISRHTMDLSIMQSKALTLNVVYMLTPMRDNVGREAHGVILSKLAALVDAGRVRPLVDSVHALADLGAAHQRLESGKAVGKVVVEVG